jgi:hypothetical protein
MKYKRTQEYVLLTVPAKKWAKWRPQDGDCISATALMAEIEEATEEDLKAAYTDNHPWILDAGSPAVVNSEQHDGWTCETEPLKTKYGEPVCPACDATLAETAAGMGCLKCGFEVVKTSDGESEEQ